MDRLTYRSCMGDYGSNKEYNSPYEEITALRNRLGQYEDTGLEPDEITANTEDCAAGFIDKQEKFEIPPEIEAKIPQYFIAAFAGELVSVFGKFSIEKDCDGDYNLIWYEHTAGWNAALKETCKRVNTDWLYEYYNSLEWSESDLFDGEIAEMVIKYLDGEDPEMTYYKYIDSKHKIHNEC